ncbi:MAG: hypothetical protein WCI29_09025 [Actinomycetes bacterium]
MTTRITIIGGGSSTFVPPLLRRLLGSSRLADATITLMDIDEAKLEVMNDLAQKLIASERSQLTVRHTTDQKDSLVDADFVITAISVGGMDAWESDIEIPGRYGIFMHVGDSIGPGGIMRALRNAPVLAAVARNAAEVAPKAFIFNYTNPAPTEAFAMRSVSPISTFALCSCAVEPTTRELLAEQAGVAPDQIAMPPVVAGINHCAAIVEMRLVDGRDAISLVRARTQNELVRWVIDTYGVLPYCLGHWVEHFPQMQRLEQEYAGTAQGIRMRYDVVSHDMTYERARGRRLEELASSWTAPDAGPVTVEDLPPGDEDSGIEVIDIIEAMLDNRSELHIVNAPNNGVISNLPNNAIVEVNALVNAYGVHPIHVGALPEALAAHLRHYVALQQQMVRAALSGSRTDALHAFLLDPSIQAKLDLDQTQALLDEMLEANKEFLPLFYQDRDIAGSG